MKGIMVCGECVDYDWKKHKCRRGKSIETDPGDPFYDDCPLPDVEVIVRCKNCKHHCYCNIEDLHKDPDWFCADGRKRDG